MKFEEMAEDCHRKADMNGWRVWKDRVGFIEQVERILETEAVEEKFVETPETVEC